MFRSILPRAQQILLGVFLLAMAISCTSPPYPQQLLLQHIPTGLAIVGLLLTSRHWPLSNASFCCVMGFLFLHVVGARYIYSYVPYNDWLDAMFGFRLDEVFSWRRNHYDRLVHFAYGAAGVVPIHEVLKRSLQFSHRTSCILAVQFIVASSAVYEMAEWVLAIVMAPEWADAYNGQQGDGWDAQKDMALALGGSLLTTLILWPRGRASVN
jgi:putative membrane protein